METKLWEPGPAKNYSVITKMSEDMVTIIKEFQGNSSLNENVKANIDGYCHRLEIGLSGIMRYVLINPALRTRSQAHSCSDWAVKEF